LDWRVLWLSLVLLQASSPQPSSAVVLGSRLKVPAARAANVVAGLTRALRSQGLDPLEPEALAQRLKLLGMRDPSVCAGKEACLVELGKQLKVDWLIAVSVAEVKRDLSVAVDVIEPGSGNRLASASGVLDAATKTLDADVGTIAGELMKPLGPLLQPAPEPRPAPVAAPAPAPVPAPVIVVAEQGNPAPAPPAAVEVKRGGPAPYLLGAGALIAAGAGAALVVAGLQLGRNTNMPDMFGVDRLSEMTAQMRLTQANVEVWSAIGLGAVTIVCAALALWLGISGGS
jgi:hypothetical protein